MHKILTMTIALLSCCGHIVQAADDVQAGARTKRVQASKYLETGGRRKLEVLYKQVSGRDLHLDLYYRHFSLSPTVLAGMELLIAHGVKPATIR